MYFAGSVQARGTKVRPHLLRAIRSNDPALKAIALLQRESGFVWRGKSRQYKQGKCNKGSNGGRDGHFEHVVPNSMRQCGASHIVPILISLPLQIAASRCLVGSNAQRAIPLFLTYTLRVCYVLPANSRVPESERSTIALRPF